MRYSIAYRQISTDEVITVELGSPSSDVLITSISKNSDLALISATKVEDSQA
jgi:hypothetical protein